LASAKSLNQCLKVIAKRGSTVPIHIEWYHKIYDEAFKGLQLQNQYEVIHGSLLVLGELLSITVQLMSDEYDISADLILGRAMSSNRLIKQTAIELIPSLARHSKNLFAINYLDQAMKYLKLALKKHNDKPVAFIAVGELTLEIGQDMKPYLDAIVELTINTLSKWSQRRGHCKEALICIRLMTEGLFIYFYLMRKNFSPLFL